MEIESQRFDIQEPALARGERATVFRAIDRKTGKRVVVKIAKPKSEEKVLEEGRLTQQVSSVIPHIRKVVELGQLDNHEYYVAYEYLPKTLKRELEERKTRRRPYSLAEAYGVLEPVAKAIDQLHARFQLAHMDLKPDNILLSATGEGCLADLGSASKLGTVCATLSPLYMTPEQAGGHPSTPASDVYGLGLILYEMLTLNPPLPTDEPAAMPIRVLEMPPISPQRWQVKLPAEVTKTLMAALEKNPRNRPPSAAALLAPLKKSTAPFPIEWVLAHKVATTSALVALGVVVLAWNLWGSTSAQIPQSTAVVVLSPTPALQAAASIEPNPSATAVPPVGPAAGTTSANAVASATARPTNSPTLVPTITATVSNISISTGGNTPSRVAQPVAEGTAGGGSAPAPNPPPPIPPPAPAATPTLLPAPRLISPNHQGSVNPNEPVVFVWEWPHALPSDYYFDLQVWQGSTPRGVASGIRGTQYTLHNRPHGGQPGVWFWRVVVVRPGTTSDRPIPVSQGSATHEFGW